MRCEPPIGVPRFILARRSGYTFAPILICGGVDPLRFDDRPEPTHKTKDKHPYPTDVSTLGLLPDQRRSKPIFKVAIQHGLTASDQKVARYPGGAPAVSKRFLRPRK